MTSLKNFKNFIQNEIELDDPLIELLFEKFFSSLMATSQPKLIILGGSPGAGKTYYRRNFLALPHFHIHDMDEVLIRLPGYQKDCDELGLKAAFERWWPIAQKIANVMVRFSFSCHYNVIYDRTCGTEESFLDLKKIHEEKLYYIIIYGFFVFERIALIRVKEREKNENRTVTPEIVKEYLRRFSALWPSYTAISNESYLLDANLGFEYSKLYEQVAGVERVFDVGHYIEFLAPGKEITFAEKFPRIKIINESCRFTHQRNTPTHPMMSSNNKESQLIKSKL